MEPPQSEIVLFGAVMAALSASGVAVFAMGASRVVAKPAAALRVVRIAILVSMALFLGLILWAVLTSAG